jgi:hypothetical protein
VIAATTGIAEATTEITATMAAAATGKARNARLPGVARLGPIRGAGPIAVALTAWDIWRRIPKQHRRLIVSQARKHGPRVAAKLMEQRQRRRPRS